MAYKQNNFYLRWRAANPARPNFARHKPLLGRVAPAIVTAALCVGAWAFLNWHTAVLQADTERLEAWYNSEENLQTYQTGTNNRTTAETMQADARLAGELRRRLDTYPLLDETVLRKLDAAGQAGIQMTLHSYDAATGVLKLNAVLEDVSDIPAYVRRLEQTGLFESVRHTGYEVQDDGYALELDCVLREVSK